MMPTPPHPRCRQARGRGCRSGKGEGVAGSVEGPITHTSTLFLHRKPDSNFGGEKFLGGVNMRMSIEIAAKELAFRSGLKQCVSWADVGVGMGYAKVSSPGKTLCMTYPLEDLELSIDDFSERHVKPLVG